MFTRRRISQITNLVLLTAAALLFALAAKADTFTAVASGDWSSSATWGGSTVGSDISAHTVIIPPGITVDMDTDVLMNGSSSNLDVNGTLQGSAHTLTVIEGDVSGVGSIVVNRIEAESNADITFTGSLEANTFINSGAQLALTCIQTIHDTLQLSGGMFVVSSASLTLDQNSEIVIDGGTFSVTSGTLIASNSYNVTYQGNSTSIGLEASGSGLNDLNCNLSNSNGQLSLSSDLQIGGELTINQGQVVVGNNSLTVNGGLTTNNGSGMLDVSSQSSLVINGDVSGGLNFTSSSETIGDLTLNLGSSNSASLGGDLQVDGSFDHQSGTCNLNGNSLSVMGDFSASGNAMFQGSSSSDLMIETSGNVDGWISFSAGNQELDSCSFDFPSSDTITIGSDLMVGSSFDFESGHVALSSNTTLDANGQVSFGSQGMFVGTSDANIEIHSSGSVNGELQFGSGSETIGNLTIDASSNGNVALGSDAGVNGSLDLQNGVLVINDNTLMINGDVSGSGSGNIQGSSNSNIEIHSSGSLSGGLEFESGGEMVNNFVVDISGNGSAMLESDLEVSGSYDGQSGNLDLNGNTLTVSGDFSGSGSAMFEGSSNSGLVIQTTGSVDGWISFSSGNEELHTCVFDFPSSDTITIGSDLMVGSSFDFESGHVALSSNTTLDANGQVSFGSQGMFVGTSDANIEIHSSGSANGELQFGSGSETIGGLTIDASSNGSVTLGSDAGVNGSLDLQNGVLVINDNTLMINGDVSGSGSGTIQGSSSSNIEIHSSGSLSGGLTFESGGQEVNDFTIDIGSNGSASIESDLSVNGELDLQNGYVMIGNNDLTIESSGSITGGSSSSYVMTNGNGSLGVMVNAGGSGTFYPVGTSASFCPATLTQANGSANGMFSVSAMSGVLVDGNSGSNMAPFTSMVDHTWFIESELNSNIDLSTTFEWTSAMEVNNFDNTDCYISHYTNASWDVAATASANVNTSGRFEISRSGFTSLSPFAVFDSGTSVGTPEVAEVEYELFPNPVKDRLRYTIKGTEGTANIDLFDNNGRLINTFQVNRQSGSINVSDLPAGYYTVRISDGETEKYSKLIKQ